MVYTIALIVLFLAVYLRKKLFLYRLLNHGEILYIDKSGSCSYRDVGFGVLARPDRITSFKGKRYVIEYKSRKKGVFDKDVVQALTGALACWDSVGGVDGVVVYNGSYELKYIKIGNKVKLARRLSKHIENAKKVKSGVLVRCRVSKSKCGNCPYNETCKWAVKR